MNSAKRSTIYRILESGPVLPVSQIYLDRDVPHLNKIDSTETDILDAYKEFRPLVYINSKYGNSLSKDERFHIYQHILNEYKKGISVDNPYEISKFRDNTVLWSSLYYRSILMYQGAEIAEEFFGYILSEVTETPFIFSEYFVATIHRMRRFSEWVSDIDEVFHTHNVISKMESSIEKNFQTMVLLLGHFYKAIDNETPLRKVAYSREIFSIIMTVLEFVANFDSKVAAQMLSSTKADILETINDNATYNQYINQLDSISLELVERKGYNDFVSSVKKFENYTKLKKRKVCVQ